MTRNHAINRPVRIAALLLLLGSVTLAGCGAQPGATGSGPNTSSLLIWYSTDDPVERVWSQELTHQFAARHPSTAVRLVDYSFEDLNTKLQLALSAGDTPDLAYVTPRGPGIPAYVGAHRLLDLTGAARAGGWAGKLRPGLLDDYNQPFGFFGARPGSIVAVPTGLAAVGVMYNRRLLERLHLQVPTSLPALEQALRRAKAAGYTPLGMGNGDGWLGDDWYLTLVNALLPPSALQPEQRLDPHFTFGRHPFVRAAQLLQQWANRGYFPQDFAGLDAQEGVDLFFHGKTLFQLVSSSENPQIVQDQQQTGLPIGVFAFPTAYGGRVMPVSGYLGWVVPKAASNRQEAIAFVDSLLSSANARLLLEHGVLPAHRMSAIPAGTSAFVAQYLRALNTSRSGVYLDAAPITNINATMEANVQLLLQGYEPPSFLVKSLQEVYTSRGKRGSTARIDGEF